MKKRIEELRQTDDAQERQRFAEAQNDYMRAEQEKVQKKAKYRDSIISQ